MMRLIEQPPSEVADFICSVCSALIWVGLRDVDHAMASLLEARKRHDNSLPFVAVEPRYDPIAQDPRFQELVRWIRRNPAERSQ